jgi:hypothetical protein
VALEKVKIEDPWFRVFGLKAWSLLGVAWKKKDCAFL